MNNAPSSKIAQSHHFTFPPRAGMLTLILCSALSPLAINAFVPSMPAMAQEFNVPYATVQLGLSLYLFMTAFIQIITGPFSDYFGRKPVLIVGFVGFLIGTAFTIMATDASMFLIGRLIQACSAVGMVLSRTIVRDVYEREKAASMMGYVSMGMAVAPMLGPAIGGALNDFYNWRATFIMLGAFGIITMFCVLFFMPETNIYRGQSPKNQWAATKLLAKTPLYWAFVAAGSLNAGAFFGFLGAGPVIADTYLNLSSSSVGIGFGITAAGYALGNFLSGRYSQKIGIAKMLIYGCLFTFIGASLPLVLLGLGWKSAIALFGPTVLIGIGNGMTIPNAIAGAISVRPDAAGTASGLMGSLQITTGAICSIICGIAAGDGNQIISFGITSASIGFVSVIASFFAANLCLRHELE